METTACFSSERQDPGRKKQPCDEGKDIGIHLSRLLDIDLTCLEVAA